MQVSKIQPPKTAGIQCGSSAGFISGRNLKFAVCKIGFPTFNPAFTMSHPTFRIAIGADHGAVDLKTDCKEFAFYGGS